MPYETGSQANSHEQNSARCADGGEHDSCADGMNWLVMVHLAKTPCSFSGAELLWAAVFGLLQESLLINSVGIVTFF